MSTSAAASVAVFEYDREAIRVKARLISMTKDDGNSSKYKASPDLQDISTSSLVRKFSVDPNLTSYETLRSLLSRAFDLKDDASESFRISYYCANEWLPMLSDWDLDAAILSASDPCLQLALVKASQREKVTLAGFESEHKVSSESAISPTAAAAQEAIHQLFVTSKRDGASFLRSTIPALTAKMQKMMEPTDQISYPNSVNSGKLIEKPALSDREFRSFLDNVGELVRPRELRIVVYKGGVEPQLRKVAWKHLLGVYPPGLDGRQRLDYMRQKSVEYDKLKNTWIQVIADGKVTEEIKMVTNMVRKDVLRTDRQHKFYSGENNENINALYNILTTFALHHPSVGYCQGMSDLLSPLLVTMMDEAHAYVCFCALMQRLKKNFMVDGQAMTKMFQHLSEGLMYYDPEFFAYLKINQADDLLFCYRWLLLEMKREFAFEDSLQVLETLWASLPPSYADKQGLPLYEVKLTEDPCQDTDKKSVSSSSDNNGTPLKARKETVYAKMVSLRRRTTSGDLKRFLSIPTNRSSSSSAKSKKDQQRSRIQSADSAPLAIDKENPRTNKQTNNEKEKLQTSATGSPTRHHQSSVSSKQTTAQTTLKITDLKDFNKLTSSSTISQSSSTNSLQSKSSSFDGDPFDHDNIGYLNGSSHNTATNGSNNNTTTTIVCDRLPEPTEFANGNPFLMFICIACLLQHRNEIMNGRFDYQEIAMFFDKLVRKHDVSKTLALARKLFAEYLNEDWATTTAKTAVNSAENQSEQQCKPSC